MGDQLLPTNVGRSQSPLQTVIDIRAYRSGVYRLQKDGVPVKASSKCSLSHVQNQLNSSSSLRKKPALSPHCLRCRPVCVLIQSSAVHVCRKPMRRLMPLLFGSIVNQLLRVCYKACSLSLLYVHIIMLVCHRHSMIGFHSETNIVRQYKLLYTP